MSAIKGSDMNYTAFAKWIETIAERERLGSPWVDGDSPRGIGAVLDLPTEPALKRAIHHVAARCDWFTRSIYITAFVEFLRRNGRLTIDVEGCPIEEEIQADHVGNLFNETT